MTMRSTTKRNLFVGVTAALILTVIIIHFNGRRLRAPKRQVLFDRKHQRQSGFVPIQRHFGKNGPREMNPSYRAEKQQGFGKPQGRNTQDRLGYNADRRGQFSLRGGDESVKSIADGDGRKMMPKVPGSVGRDWWKIAALKKYPAGQAPLGQWVNTSRFVKPKTGGSLFDAPRTDGSDGRNRQSSFGKAPQITNNNIAHFPKKVGEEKLQGNRFGVDKSAGNTVGESVAIKRYNGSGLYDGRQRMKPSPGVGGRLASLGSVHMEREGLRRKDGRRQMWTEEDKAAALQQTRSTDKTQDGPRTQGEFRNWKQRPIDEQGDATDTKKNPRILGKDVGPGGSQPKGQFRGGRQRLMGQRGDSVDTNGDPQARGKNGLSDWSRIQEQSRGGTQRQLGQRGDSTDTHMIPRSRDSKRGPDGSQSVSPFGDEKQRVGSTGTRRNRPGAGVQGRDRDQTPQREGREQREGRGQVSRYEGRERKEPFRTERQKQEVMTKDDSVRKAGGMGEGRRTSGDNAGVLKKLGDKYVSGNIRGENGYQKQKDTGAIGGQKRRPDDQLVKKTSGTDRIKNPFDAAADQKRRWPKYANN